MMLDYPRWFWGGFHEAEQVVWSMAGGCFLPTSVMVGGVERIIKK